MAGVPARLINSPRPDSGRSRTVAPPTDIPACQPRARLPLNAWIPAAPGQRRIPRRPARTRILRAPGQDPRIRGARRNPRHAAAQAKPPASRAPAETPHFCDVKSTLCACRIFTIMTAAGPWMVRLSTLPAKPLVKWSPTAQSDGKWSSVMQVRVSLDDSGDRPASSQERRQCPWRRAERDW